MAASRSCGVATAIGEVSLDDSARRPKTMAFALAGVEVVSADIRDGDDGSGAGAPWRPMAVRRAPIGDFPTDVSYVTVIAGRVGQRRYTFGPYFRLHLRATREAGHRSCYVTTPGLFEYPGDTEYWSVANSLGYLWFEKHGHADLDYAPLADALVRVSVDGMVPDRSALDANAAVQRRKAVLACTGNIPSPPDDKHDPFATLRTLSTTPNCGSVQRFAASDAAADLNRRIFIAGLLASAALGMLLEAAMLGRTRTAVPESEAPATHPAVREEGT